MMGGDFNNELIWLLVLVGMYSVQREGGKRCGYITCTDTDHLASGVASNLSAVFYVVELRGIGDL